MSSIQVKIQALLSLSANNSNQAEAEQALAKAMALMEQYSISEEALKDLEQEAIITLSYSINKQMIFKGCQMLIGLLAKHFGVLAYLKGKKELMLTGHESKLHSCVALIDYLLQNSKYNLPKGFSYTEKQGYYLGYYTAIKPTLTATKPSEEGLVLLNKDMAKYQEIVGVLKLGTSRKISCSQDAKNLGASIGSKANLARQFGTRALPGK